jgi:hypothetical protein
MPEKRKIQRHNRENLKSRKKQHHLDPSLKLKDSAPEKEFWPKYFGYILPLITKM